MQDSQNRQVQGGLGMDLWCPIKMVGSFLHSRGDEALALLSDARAKVATDEVGVVDEAGVPKVSGWGVCCCDFLLLPVAPSVSCSCPDAPRTRSSELPPSPAVSYCLPPSTTRLSYT